MTVIRKLLLVVGTILIISALFSAYCDITASMKDSGKKTQAEISNLQSLLQSQDKVIEDIHGNAAKEVRVKNAEIIGQIKMLSPDAVADGLSALLAEYRRERAKRD